MQNLICSRSQGHATPSNPVGVIACLPLFPHDGSATVSGSVTATDGAGKAVTFNLQWVAPMANSTPFGVLRNTTSAPADAGLSQFGAALSVAPVLTGQQCEITVSAPSSPGGPITWCWDLEVTRHYTDPQPPPEPDQS